MNVLSVDVEDYFHVEAFASNVNPQHWNSYESRVERNVQQILELFARNGAKGTFFILGWVAEKFPNLSKQIAAAGHEIGCHSFAHRRIHGLTPEQFRADLRRATRLLEDQVQRPIRCFRAPSFSVVRSTFWALDILVEEGFTIDSSVFPVQHDLYGVPDAERFPHVQTTASGNQIFEFPPSTVRLRGTNVGVAGGGYLRFAPYRLTRQALRHINHSERQPGMIYFHPWEIDPDQPRIPASFRSRVRHYTNLSGMYRRIECLLKDFKFTTLSAACTSYPAYLRIQPKLLNRGLAKSMASGR